MEQATTISVHDMEDRPHIPRLELCLIHGYLRECKGQSGEKSLAVCVSRLSYLVAREEFMNLLIC